jgi:hypothetical protein
VVSKKQEGVSKCRFGTVREPHRPRLNDQTFYLA